MNPYAKHYQAENTERTYRSAHAKFTKWCSDNNHPHLPATPEITADYLSALASRGLKPSSIAVARAAIDDAHHNARHSPPGASRLVKQTMQGINRVIGVEKEQKKGITGAMLRQMALTASADFAWTIAAISVMRDGMLRGSELLALKTADIKLEDDGSSRVHIARSKTDKTGEGAVVYLSAETTARLLPIWYHHDGYVFSNNARKKMMLKTLSRRIKRLVLFMDIDPTHYSTHSPRIGMAQDLLVAGKSSAAIANAGRWSSITQVLNYTRNITAGAGAVAQYYQDNSQVTT